MKKIKNVVFLLLVSALMIGNALPVNAQQSVGNGKIEYEGGYVEFTDQAFIYDYSFQVKLAPTLENGKEIAVSTMFKGADDTYKAASEDLKARVGVVWYNLKEIEYQPEGYDHKLTGKDLYDYIVEIQNKIDQEAENGTVITYNNSTSESSSDNVNKLNALMRAGGTVKVAGKDGQALYCFGDTYHQKLELPTTCYDEYYIVSVVFVYLDDNGNVVDQRNVARAYKVDADKTKCPVCTVDDGKYYNSKGDEVTKDEYNKDCNSCRKENNKYYDKDGKEVTKEQWNKDCGNPDTGIDNPYIIIAIVVAAGAGIAFISKKKKYV